MRAAIYTRVSSEEQLEGHSLSAQSELDKQLASQREWEVVNIYEERGRSGKTVLRPEFQRMMRDAEAGLFDVIIVHKLDRFSRSVADVMTYLKRLNEFGVSLVSVTENFDFTTAGGKMLMGVLAVFAEWYIDNLSQETSKGKKERARKGGWNGTLPFGYTNIRRLRQTLLDLGEDYEAQKIDEDEYSRLTSLLEDALLQYENRVGETDAIPCPINKYGVILAFEKYSQEIYSDLDVTKALNAAGYRTTGTWGNNPFGKDTVTPMLQNHFYIGETSYQGKKKGAKKEFIPGRHEPLISRELFEKCQEVRAKRASDWSHGAPNQTATYPLSSLLVCADCGSKWRGWHLRMKRHYRDPGTDRGHICSSEIKSVVADSIEATAANFLMSVELPENWRDQILQHMAKENPNYAQVKKQHSSLQSKLDRLKQLFVMGDISDAEYIQMRDELQAQIGLLPLPSQGRMIDLERAAELLGNISSIWDGATLEEREVWFKLMFNKIYVKDGAIKAIEPTSVMSALLDTPSGSDGIRTRDLCLDRAIC